MPTYDYKCPACGHVKEVIHSIKESPRIVCDLCMLGGGENNAMERQISLSAGGFILGSSESMAWKEKRIRHKRNADLEVKQIDRWGSGPKLQPNVAGMEVDSWSDAAKLAKEAGMSDDSYKGHIEKEKSTGESGVDDRKWKAAKDNKDKA